MANVGQNGVVYFEAQWLAADSRKGGTVQPFHRYGGESLPADISDECSGKLDRLVFPVQVIRVPVVMLGESWVVAGAGVTVQGCTPEGCVHSAHRRRQEKVGEYNPTLYTEIEIKR